MCLSFRNNHITNQIYKNSMLVAHSNDDELKAVVSHVMPSFSGVSISRTTSIGACYAKRLYFPDLCCLF
ncbi:hypothetical protein EMIT0324P_60078 [Pseudomonas chlororaphis]